MSGTGLYEKYFLKTIKVKFARFVRVGMCKLGIYAFAKRMITRMKALR